MLRKLTLLAAVAALALCTVQAAVAKNGKPAPSGPAWGQVGVSDGR